MFGILIILHVCVCLVLIFIVMLQGGRGAELGAAFGGVGQANTSRGTMSGIAKVTATAAGIFMVTSFTLAYLSSEKAIDSVVKDSPAVSTPAVPASTPPAKDTTPAEAVQKDSSSLEQKTEGVTTQSAEQEAPTLEQKEAPPMPAEQEAPTLEQKEAPPMPAATKTGNSQ
ncbi:MAG: preprotein translocase subunit SecG [SAR324 cluster bacterium]|nr:preprotein translocase subunit SecG [SAR324 cluster bacterium]